MNIHLTQNLTATVTGHGKTNSYLHRFELIKTPICPCGNSDHNIDRLIFECKLLSKESNALKASILKTNDWPTSKRDLIKKHIKGFMKFTNATLLDEINAEQNSSKPKCQTVSSQRTHPSKGLQMLSVAKRSTDRSLDATKM